MLIGRRDIVERCVSACRAGFEDAAGGRLVMVVGLGGIGKTALLDAVVAEVGHAPIVVGMGDRLAAIAGALAAPGATPTAAAAPAPARFVVVDRAEDLSDVTLFDMAARSPRTTFLVARRAPPGAALRLDPRWHMRATVITLDGLAPHDAATLLVTRGVPEARARSLAPRFGGHPLTLLLAGEALRQAPDASLDDALPTVLHEILDVVLAEPPSTAHRRTLEASAVMPEIDVGTLRFVLERADPGALAADVDVLWGWLVRQPYGRTSASGFDLHDTLRELLLAELVWREPSRLAALYRAAGALSESWRTSGLASARARALDLIEYLTAHHPVWHATFPRPNDAAYTWSPATRADLPALAAIVRVHEGAAGVAALSAWLGRATHAHVMRERASGAVVGLLMPITRSELALAGASNDSLLDALEALARARGVAPGDEVLHQRWMFAAEAYHLPTPTLTEVLLRSTRITHRVWPRLLTFATPAIEAWRPFAERIGYAIEPDRVMVDGVSYGLMVRAWQGIESFAFLWQHELWEETTEAVAGSANGGSRALHVGPHAAWFGTAAGYVDMQGRPVLRRVLAALVGAHRQVPGCTLTVDELRATGWPGEVSTRARVHVAISTLRKLGLGEHIVTHDGGYGLDRGVRIVDEVAWPGA